MKLLHGIVDAGTQWTAVFEECLIKSANRQRVSEASWLHVLKDALNLSMAKVKDNLLLANNRK